MISPAFKISISLLGERKIKQNLPRALSPSFICWALKCSLTCTRKEEHSSCSFIRSPNLWQRPEKGPGVFFCFFSGGLTLSEGDSLLALFHCREEKRSTNGMRRQWFKKPTRKLTLTKGFALLRAARVGRAQRKALVPANTSGPWACPSNGKCQLVAKGVDSLRFILAFAGSRLEINLCYSGNQDPLPPSRYLLHTSWGELG